ncbi:MAG: hypothetical protein FWF38_07350 [Spirochaetaceae bacterium]|nr:hypothetical protein [Spirochaetaceae bacterium]
MDEEDIINENQIERNHLYIKKKYFYRSLIARGRSKIKSLESAKRLVGPDTAYHLCSSLKKINSSNDS